MSIEAVKRVDGVLSEEVVVRKLSPDVSREEEVERRRPGFCSEDEVGFLRRTLEEDSVGDVRGKVLLEQLVSQLGEDLGMVSFPKTFLLVDGRLVDTSGPLVKMNVVRGKVEQGAWRMIEKGLARKDGRMWVHFSPKNEMFGYDRDCVDIWRWEKEEGEEDRVRYQRIVVKQGLAEMKVILKSLSGIEVVDKMEMLAQPVATSLKMADVLLMFDLMDKKTGVSWEVINEVVDKLVAEFQGEYGPGLYGREDLIFRLYSAIHGEIDRIKQKVVLEADWEEGLNFRTRLYMVQPLRREVRPSFGCSGSTMVGTLSGTGEGMRIIEVGGKLVVKKERVRAGDVLCFDCGCYYDPKKWSSCPLCTQ